MERTIRPLVIGNWKMNPQTAVMAERIAREVKGGLTANTDADVVVAPPNLYMSVVHKVRNGSNRFILGAQDAFYEKLGAHTGNVSAFMLESFGVAFAIIGHSERRALGETDDVVNKKVHAVLKAGMTVVVCVGEAERDVNAQYLEEIEQQIRKACAGVTRARLRNVVIAYEPVWAIGSGKTPTPEDVHEMRLFIQKIFADLYGRSAVGQVRILYGGSVSPKNAGELFTEGGVHGFLVGGASIRPADFIGIIKACTSV